MKAVLNPSERPCAKQIKDSFDLVDFKAVKDKNSRLRLMLCLLLEIEDMRYKAECATKEYLICEFATAHNAYADIVQKLKEMIIKEAI
jgi:hypothetical protein